LKQRHRGRLIRGGSGLNQLSGAAGLKLDADGRLHNSIPDGGNQVAILGLGEPVDFGPPDRRLRGVIRCRKKPLEGFASAVRRRYRDLDRFGHISPASPRRSRRIIFLIDGIKVGRPFEAVL
jgi:hypothetical protein